MRLSALVEEFLVDCRSRRLSPKTVSWYRANLRYLLDWLRAHDELDALHAFTLVNARRYSQDLAERGARHGTFVGGASRRGVDALVETDQLLTANTFTGYLRALKTFSRWLAAEEQGYTHRDVLAGLRTTIVDADTVGTTWRMQRVGLALGPIQLLGLLLVPPPGLDARASDSRPS